MKKAHILVVDDEPDLVDLIEHHLRREQYEVAKASDGETALAEARRRVPDLIVLDLMLPGTDGLAACRRPRWRGGGSGEGTANTPSRSADWATISARLRGREGGPPLPGAGWGALGASRAGGMGEGGRNAPPRTPSPPSTWARTAS